VSNREDSSVNVTGSFVLLCRFSIFRFRFSSMQDFGVMKQGPGMLKAASYPALPSEKPAMPAPP
jgi:hypothetical protein